MTALQSSLNIRGQQETEGLVYEDLPTRSQVLVNAVIVQVKWSQNQMSGNATNQELHHGGFKLSYNPSHNSRQVKIRRPNSFASRPGRFSGVADDYATGSAVGNLGSQRGRSTACWNDCHSHLPELLRSIG